MTEDDATRKILKESGIPFSIDAEGCIHFDVDAVDRALDALDEELDDDEDAAEDEN